MRHCIITFEFTLSTPPRCFTYKSHDPKQPTAGRHQPTIIIPHRPPFVSTRRSLLPETHRWKQFGWSLETLQVVTMYSNAHTHTNTTQTHKHHTETHEHHIHTHTCVKPGIAEVGASAFRLTSMFTSEDLPTLDRPIKTTSGSAFLPFE